MTTMVSLLLLMAAAPDIAEAEKFGLRRNRTVAEFYPRENNPDPDWWVSSGAYFAIKDRVGSTVKGELAEDDRFRQLYSKSNPVDTDGGKRPQNIFRLVTQKSWKSYMQQVYFRIDGTNLTDSPNRNQSNGILFFVGYKNKDYLYYAGLRVDGTAVIKKKMGSVGDYHTLDQRRITDGEYDRDSAENANRLPAGKWTGLRASREVAADGTVRIRLWMDADSTGNWKLVAEAVDDGTKYGAPFNEEGNGGIRTDFMDVSFHSFAVRDLDRRPERPEREDGRRGGRK